MKRLYIAILLITTFLVFGVSSTTYAKKNNVPEKINSFIEKNFKNIKIADSVKDVDGIEVKLNDGTKIFFNKSNEWTSIKSNQSFIKNFLPKVVLNSYNKNYPKETILKVNKNWCGYSVFTEKNREIYFDKNGLILGIVDSDKN